MYDETADYIQPSTELRPNAVQLLGFGCMLESGGTCFHRLVSFLVYDVAFAIALSRFVHPFF